MIAQEVINGFSNSIEEVLPGYKKMKNSLTNLCKQNLENQFETKPEIKANWDEFRSLEENQNVKSEADPKRIQSRGHLKLSEGLTEKAKRAVR